MNATTQATPETVNARLTLDVTYLLNGEAAPELLARLERMCELAIGEGLLTGETAAEVDTWSIDVSEVPSAPTAKRSKPRSPPSCSSASRTATSVQRTFPCAWRAMA
ncbi:hypothetical protein WJ968_31440 [Achromobacter xylosoxidans]